MSETPHVTNSPSEKNASSQSSPASAAAVVSSTRSCLVCRTRKVRCDKLSPCSNCRRANIACVLPSKDRPLRWARRLQRVGSNGAPSIPAQENTPTQVMERLRNLEGLVKDLRVELEQANAAATSAAGGPSGADSIAGSNHDDIATDYQRDASHDANAGNVHKSFGRLVLQDADRSLYVSNGFWSRVNDELDGLDSDTSDDEVAHKNSTATQELHRTPSDRHAFLFGHNWDPTTPNLREFHPLPSQIPFLLDVFSENVNRVLPIIHIPTVAKMVRNLRGDVTALTPANEALMFSIYYAAITSMEEDDIMTNFGFTKVDLNLKYRLGLEYALAKADFLHVPNLVLVQAFTIFLSLVRRYDSPRFVWMMTGLAIRMGQALGLHRDGTHFEHLTPYEIEMRRRVWWALCMLDMRASEDQGTDFTIARGSFDTKLPLNINDTDINPESTQMPTAHDGITDMTLPLVWFEIGEVSKQLMAQSSKGGESGMEEQSRLLNEIYQKLDRGYLQYPIEPGNIAYWLAIVITRLVMAKMALLIYVPILFSSPTENFSETIKSKLLVAAIEVAEYNHALNSEQGCHQWHWICQTYTHWYAIVYLLLEVSRRPWSPTIERAWVALHSEWLIPAQSHLDKSLQVWIPLRRLTAKARKHRHAELERLRRDPQAARQLEMEDQKIPAPSRPGLFPAESNVVDLFRERWRQLIAIPGGAGHDAQTRSEPEATSSSAHSTYASQLSTSSIPTYSAGGSGNNITFEPPYFGANGLETSQNLPSNNFPNFQSAMTTNAPGDFSIGKTSDPSCDTFPVDPTAGSTGAGFFPWLWTDADPSVDIFASVDVDASNMDLDCEVDWYNWIQGMEVDVRPNDNGQA